MGVKNGENDDNMDWTDNNENAFLSMLHEKVKRDPKGAPTFKTSDWNAMDNELYLSIGERYGAERLKGKYNRLRSKHRYFSDLLEHIGVTYDLGSNTVFAPEDVWQMFFKKNKIFKSFRKSGCKNYQLLGQVFDKSTASGLLHHSSTMLPPSSDEERQTEENFLNKGIHVTESGTSSSKGKRPAEDFLPGCIRVKKESKLEKLDSCLQIWASTLEARAKKDLAKAAIYNDQSSNKATSPVFDPYTIEECMDVLESMENVPDDSYTKALEKFKDPDWRKMFIKMSSPRRKIKRELFNHRHSTLRNVIERAFGALKARFPILKSIPNYPLRRQKLIPIACCTLHNFIRMEDRADTLFTMYEREGLVVEDELGFDVVQEGIEVDMSQQNQMAAVRDVIANEIWDDYNRR
ncbi:hypothetical protein AQUCO_00500632v1 [Aquilegia coerulea]|uniref:Uncharacterized protein n=1 Tax=Aquilegia coerulea TaxID=218851 RepID=A0A2G5EST7_AQUCA|nr:hypothetical protein AQUCO_00500632v1 [Aquilegia coerulea]